MKKSNVKAFTWTPRGMEQSEYGPFVPLADYQQVSERLERIEKALAVLREAAHALDAEQTESLIKIATRGRAA